LQRGFHGSGGTGGGPAGEAPRGTPFASLVSASQTSRTPPIPGPITIAGRSSQAPRPPRASAVNTAEPTRTAVRERSQRRASFAATAASTVETVKSSLLANELERRRGR